MADHLCLICKWGQSDKLAYAGVDWPQSLCQMPEPAPEVKLPHYARRLSFETHPGDEQSILVECSTYIGGL